VRKAESQRGLTAKHNEKKKKKDAGHRPVRGKRNPVSSETLDPRQKGSLKPDKGKRRTLNTHLPFLDPAFCWFWGKAGGGAADDYQCRRSVIESGKGDRIRRDVQMFLEGKEKGVLGGRKGREARDKHTLSSSDHGTCTRVSCHCKKDETQ